MNFQNWYDDVKSIIEGAEGSVPKLFDYPHTITQFERYYHQSKTPREAVTEFALPHGNEHGEDIWD